MQSGIKRPPLRWVIPLVLMVPVGRCGGSTSVVGTWKSSMGVVVAIAPDGRITLIEGTPPAFLADTGPEPYWGAIDHTLTIFGKDANGTETYAEYEFRILNGGKALHITSTGQQGKAGGSIPHSWSFYRQ